MQLEASLGAEDCPRLTRCRGLTDGEHDDITEPPKLKRSKRCMLSFDDKFDDELTESQATVKPLSSKFSATRDKESPHNDALFYFFLRNLDEVLASFSHKDQATRKEDKI